MTTDDFDELTCRIPFETNKQLVFGAPRPRRVRLPFRLIFVVACLSAIGCVTARPAAVDVESVGTLSASATHVYSAPTHATTDFAPAANVADSGDDLPNGKTSLDVLRDEAAKAGTVDVASKTDGVTVGGVR